MMKKSSGNLMSGKKAASKVTATAPKKEQFPAAISHRDKQETAKARKFSPYPSVGASTGPAGSSKPKKPMPTLPGFKKGK